MPALRAAAAGPQHEFVVVLAASGQPQRIGQVAGVGAREQLDQAEPGELLLHRGGGQAGAAGEEAALAAQELLGLEAFDSSRLATFTARLRQDGFLEPVTAALCRLARQLDEHGAPVDYARRRRLRRLSQARLDVTAWRRGLGNSAVS
jgi:hypothetical protein